MHQPVMLEQVVDLLRPRPGGTYVDLTLGAGGHARALLQLSAPNGRLLAIDRDPQAIRRAAETLACFSDRLRLVHSPFSELPELLRRANINEVDGLLADLGVCSAQLDRAERGFSFQRPGPLDMRMDPTRGPTLAERLERLDAEELAAALRRLGEVNRARSVAKRILEALGAGRLTDTLALAKTVGQKRSTDRIHPATRVFLALRMMVNEELEQLDAVLRWLPEPLKPGGRVVFIAFHSLEDRAVKHRFAQLSGRCTCPPDMPACRCGQWPVMRSLTRRVLRPTAAEVAANPRARSARLRVAERLLAG